jgi:hypothetical protein
VEPIRLLQQREGRCRSSRVDLDRGEHREAGRLDARVAHLSGTAEVGLVDLAGPLEVTRVVIRPSEAPRAPQRVVLVTRLAEEPDPFLEKLACPEHVAGLGLRVAERVHGVGHPPRVPELAVERERLLPP